MILEVVKYGNPVLRAKGLEVKKADDKLRQLATDMLETMHAHHGVGLAAQQVGVPLQLTVIDVSGVEDRPSAMFIEGEHVEIEKHMPLVLLNPKLKLSADKETANEGCLSFPDMNAEIARAAGVRCTATRLDGTEWTFEATGLLARALQHETDHLHGVLFIDRMSSAARASLAGKLKRLQREVRK
jgi:peptide deformylase